MLRVSGSVHIIEDVPLTIPCSTRVILEDVDLDVQAGKKVFICGETGR